MLTIMASLVVEAQAEGLEDVGKAVGAVCLMDVVHLPVFGPQVVKEGCIGERLDNDESEDANVASMSPKMNPNGGSSAGGSPVWNS